MMKAEKINVQITINVGNYESLRLGGEWTPDMGQSEADALKEADKILRAAAVEILAEHGPTTAPTRLLQSTKSESLNELREKMQQNAKSHAERLEIIKTEQQPTPAEKTPQIEEKAAKIKLTTETLTSDGKNLLQAITKRIEQRCKTGDPVTLESLLNIYDPDDQARAVLDLATKLN